MDISTSSVASEFDQLEARSLVSVEKHGPMDKMPTRHYDQFRWRSIQAVLLLSLCAAITLFKEDVMTLLISDARNVGDMEMGRVVTKNATDELMYNALEGKRMFDETQAEDYGEYAEQIFDTVSVMGYFASPTALSKERLKRSLQMKIIQTLLEPDKEVTFTWAVGGHSAAAGHGNLFKQAYANIIEESLRPIFESIGIQFYAKNYAMGGTKSAPEVALCMESIFGPDVDIISWDYGMTDGRARPLYNLWMQRARLHPSRPILFSFGQRYSSLCHVDLESDGGAGFASNYDNARNIFPNSDDPEVNTTDFPRAVKDYICNNGHVETGDPCGEKEVKFHTIDMCPVIGYQTSWHNGWKDHLFIGRIASAFIIENLLEAIHDMIGEPDGNHTSGASTIHNEHDEDGKMEPSLSASYLHYLQELKDKETAQFFQNEPLEDIFDHGYGIKEANFTHFQRSRGWCRTSLLPSQARYDGVVMESNSTVTYLHGGRTDYEDEGHPITHLPTPEPDNDETPIHLAYNIKNNRNICKYAEIDFKDTFFVRDEDNWMETTIPNDAELEYFDTIEKPQGVITICTLVMDWNKYPADYVTIPEMVGLVNITDPVEGDWGIMINGKKATGATAISNDKRCFVLKHDQDEGGYYFPDADNGRYKLQFRVPRAGNLYISSMTVM